MADEPSLADGPPSESKIDALNTTTPYLADEPTLADGPPSELRIDALDTDTLNLADEPTLADGPPSESRIDALNTTTPRGKLEVWFIIGRTNLLWPMDPPVNKQ